MEVASLEPVPLREVWRDEARDFTPWLAANPEHLSRALGMDLELVDSEVAVGPFSADVVLRDSNTHDLVVVENFLERTDHDHLGKLITYASGLEASWAVLVAKDFRPEHRSALHWLNKISGSESGFFGVELNAVRIGDSAPAVKLDVVVEPDDFTREVRASNKAETAGTSRYRDWWREFLPEFHSTYPGWSNSQTPSSGNWTNFPSGRSGTVYSLAFSWPKGASRYRLKAGVYLHEGDEAFAALEEQRSAIEESCELELIWDDMPDARAAQIFVTLEDADPDDRESWPRYREWAISTLGELRRCFATSIAELP